MPSLTRLTSEHPLTKTVSLKDGVLKKQLATPMTKGTAERVTFQTFSDLAQIWTSLSKHQAFVHGDYYGPDTVSVVTKEELNGQPNTISRTKEHFRFADTFLIDYDPKDKPLDGKALLAILYKVFPGFEACGYVARKSTGAGIYNGSEQIADSHGLHFVFRAQDGSDIGDFGKRLSDHLWCAGYGRIEISESGQMLERVLIDSAVFSPERIHFAAGANCEKPLVQKLPKPRIVEGSAVDTRALADIDASGVIEAAKRKAEPLAKKQRTKYRCEQIEMLSEHDEETAAAIVDARLRGKLLAEQKLELDSGETVTVAELIAGDYDGATMKDPLEPDEKNKAVFSVEMMSIFSHLHGGMVYKLRLNFDAAMAQLKKNSGEFQKIHGLSQLTRTQDEQFVQKAARLNGVPKTVIRADLAQGKPKTHADMAQEYIDTFDNAVFANGKLWYCLKSIWTPVTFDQEKVAIGKQFNEQPKCQRGGDYRQIADHANSIIDDPEFFQGAPDGVACGTTFYYFDGDELKSTNLTAEHRQRFVIDTPPRAEDPTMFLDFLNETFKGDDPESQIRIMQEIFGTVLLGTMYQLEKVALFYGPGNSGKSTVLRILQGMIPVKFQCAVSPDRWDHDYHLAALAGMRLNSVGELGGHPLTTSFKTVTGRDLMQARFPYEKPFAFHPEVSHIFNSNQLPETFDVSTAFFRRWVILVFKNSRVNIAETNIVDLDQQILDAELGQIVHWSMHGAQRVKDQNCFSGSTVAENLEKRWKAASDGVAAWREDCTTKHEPEERDTKQDTKMPDVYRSYADYCSDHEYSTLSKRKFRARLEELGERVTSHGDQGRFWVHLTIHAAPQSEEDEF